MKDKIIFLDMDGVLVIKGDNFCIGDNELSNLNEGCVASLNMIVEKTGAKIILSSDWRLYESLERIADHLKWSGVKGDVIGKTEILDSRDLLVTGGWGGYGRDNWAALRTAEIEKYIIENKVHDWVALDDLYLGAFPRNKHMHTTWERGLLLEHVQAAIKELNKNDKEQSVETPTDETSEE